MIRRDRNHASVILWEAELNESDNSMAAELYRIVHEEYPGQECYTSGNPVHGAAPNFKGAEAGIATALVRMPGPQVPSP